MLKRLFSYAAAVGTVVTANFAPAWAQEQHQHTEGPQAPPMSMTPSPMSQPSMVGPLAANPNPLRFNAGPLGDVYVTGVASGFAQLQNNAALGDRRSQADISNGQIIVQKIDGLFQFYAQAGAYSLPALGTPYVRASKTMDNLYGPLPVAFAKLAPTESFSIQAGKLPTLIGAEYTFTFENFNIQRGLLWNQENAVSRGVQANYAAGPLALSVAWTDGFYSNRMSWLSGSATYAFNSANSLSFIAGGNTDRTRTSTLATPLFLNNSQIYNLIYTYNSDQWTVVPYLQYTYVPKYRAIGANDDAATYGGAVFVKYAFRPDSGLEGVSLPVRLEYIASNGSAAHGAPNLMYGPGSKAWSVTVTPTYQHNIFFARAEASYVKASGTVPGLSFGINGNSKTQARLLFEGGVLF